MPQTRDLNAPGVIAKRHVNHGPFKILGSAKRRTLSVAGSLATLTIAKDFSITQGTFAGGTATINVAGNWNNLGTFTANTSTVVFNGNAVAQTISGNTSFNNLTINHIGAGNVDASTSTLAVTGLLRIQQGTFISFGQFNNVQIDSGATLQGSNGTTMSVSGNWANTEARFTPVVIRELQWRWRTNNQRNVYDSDIQ